MQLSSVHSDVPDAYVHRLLQLCSHLGRNNSKCKSFDSEDVPEPRISLKLTFLLSYGNPDPSSENLYKWTEAARKLRNKNRKAKNSYEDSLMRYISSINEVKSEETLLERASANIGIIKDQLYKEKSQLMKIISVETSSIKMMEEENSIFRADRREGLSDKDRKELELHELQFIINLDSDKKLSEDLSEYDRNEYEAIKSRTEYTMMRQFEYFSESMKEYSVKIKRTITNDEKIAKLKNISETRSAMLFLLEKKIQRMEGEPSLIKQKVRKLQKFREQTEKDHRELVTKRQLRTFMGQGERDAKSRAKAFSLIGLLVAQWAVSLTLHIMVHTDRARVLLRENQVVTNK